LLPRTPILETFSKYTNSKAFLETTPIKMPSYTGYQLKRLLTKDTNFREFLHRTPILETSEKGDQLKSLLTQDTY